MLSHGIFFFLFSHPVWTSGNRVEMKKRQYWYSQMPPTTPHHHHPFSLSILCAHGTHTPTTVSPQQHCGWWMTLQLVIKAGEWSRVAERWFLLLLHSYTMLLLLPSGSGLAAPGAAKPCHLPPLLFIRGTLALLTQAKKPCLLSTFVFNK